MRRLLPVVAVLSWGCPASVGAPSKECGIVGGHDEDAFDAVGMVVTATGSCTGTLIAPRVVVTAQHCFDPDTRAEEVGFVTGRLGERLEAAGVELFYLGQFERREDEDGAEWWWIDTENDFAVLALDHDPSVAPMPYRPDAVGFQEEGSAVDIVGYGTTGLEREDSGSKRSGRATLSWVGPDWMETERRAGEASGCYGDSGGPLILDGEVVGVFSYFVDLDDVCESGGQYVRIDRYTDLIDDGIAAAEAHVSVDEDTCEYANDGECDEGTWCYPGTDATDCVEVEDDDHGDSGCACDDGCAVRGDCCSDCAETGRCDAGFCVAGDDFCDEDMACCESDSDCGADPDDDPGIDEDPRDDERDPLDGDDRDERRDPGYCEEGLCVAGDGYCDEDQPCCQEDADCRVDC